MWSAPSVPQSGTPAQSWRPWSVPLDPVDVQRKLCGLLNKLNHTNFDRISDQIVYSAVMIDRTEDLATLEILAGRILTWAITDTQRARLYASLCQKIVDEQEGERSRWRMIDMYYLGNPIHSFEAAMQTLSSKAFEHISVEGSMEHLRAFARFSGELLVHGVLLPDDVEDILGTLFLRAEKSDEDFVVILCDFLLPIIRAPDAYRFLDALAIVEGVERVLQEDSLSLKARSILMNVLDEALCPTPYDTFNSGQRNEVYGLEAEVDETERADSPQAPPCGVQQELLQHCRSKAYNFLVLERKLASAENFFKALEPTHRHVFVTSLVSLALSSDDHSDANLVALLFSRNTVRDLCHPEDSFVKGFEWEILMLEDTVLDIPQAYRLLAVMLYACGLNRNIVEDLSAKIIVEENCARDRFLHEYLSLEFAECVVEDDLATHSHSS